MPINRPSSTYLLNPKNKSKINILVLGGPKYELRKFQNSKLKNILKFKCGLIY